MPDLLPLLGRTFLIGLAVAAPVGAMGVLCIGRTLASGPRAGLATGLGIATADGIYASLAAFGLTALSSLLVAWALPIRIVGGVALVALGVRVAMSAPREVVAEPVADHARLYASAVGLTLSNPMTIMAFGAVFASAGLVTAGMGTAAAFVATLGVASGSAAWWLALVAVVAGMRARVDSRALTYVTRVSGGLLVAFGVFAAVSALR